MPAVGLSATLGKWADRPRPHRLGLVAHHLPDSRLSISDRRGGLIWSQCDLDLEVWGHVAFLDRRDGALIAGDTFTAYGRLAVASHFYFRFPFAAVANWDKAEVLQSAKRLRSIEPAVMVVGHGPAARDPAAAMDHAIARAGASPAPPEAPVQRSAAADRRVG